MAANKRTLFPKRSTNKPLTLRLTLIWVCSFTKNEYTNLGEAVQAYPNAKYGNGNCIVLLSRMGDQIVFVNGYYQLGTASALDTRRLRLTSKETWSPDMLANYAERVGIQFDSPSIRRLEDAIAAEDKRKAEARATARAKRLAERGDAHVDA